MAAAAAGAGSGPWAAQEKQFPPALLSFFIYNPRFGPREGEEENKILFYHPNEVEKNEKIRNVGLCEAIVQFTRTFSPSKPAKSLHTQKNRQFFNEPEENFWMVMVVRNPIVEKQSKDGKPVIEYQEEELLDKVYSSVLQQCYSMYKSLITDGYYMKVSFFPPFHNLWFVLSSQAMSAAVCFMIDASIQPTLDFCRRLDGIVGPQLTVLASDICEQFNINKRMSGSEKEPQFKFIYFNHMNLAEKSTVHMRKTPSVSLTSVHPDLMKILGDINSDFTRVDEDEEIIVKAMSDYWVVGKKSDRRELYVILNQKNANLIEVNEEVKKLCATQFNNIFFLD
ncbi:vacuolar fusion protein CCZ1 homolog B-like [Nomascus leucogenys]|uniref:vacuolar fusion protein CCZ1 homolog B-like n=1 Tax=Nomascus leucogenys TaxID=61853 RepID=UPI00122D9A76|nr:vacuolar fusion protein CCZ1 homolog B-like [Nomascus leucogenys]